MSPRSGCGRFLDIAVTLQPNSYRYSNMLPQLVLLVGHSHCHVVGFKLRLRGVFANGTRGRVGRFSVISPEARQTIRGRSYPHHSVTSRVQSLRPTGSHARKALRVSAYFTSSGFERGNAGDLIGFRYKDLAVAPPGVQQVYTIASHSPCVSHWSRGDEWRNVCSC